MPGANVVPFINVPSAMITVGGTFAALLINFPLGDVLGVVSVVKNCFLTKLPTAAETIEQFKELSAVARRDGILALEEKITDINDDFMQRGLGMVISGTGKEEVQAVMETEIGCIDERHKLGKKMRL